MVIISEVNSVVDLVLKLTSFANRLQDGWYKGSAEVDSFRDQVFMLTQKHYQWSAQLRRHGLSEDQRLLQAVQAAVQVLDAQEKYVRSLEKNRLWRLTRKAFPDKLSYSLNRIMAIVDAGPQLLAGRVTTYDLMERSRVQTPAPLPFTTDRNYVPISESILEIRKALEDEEGPRVVNVFGGPGLGKSSVVKYVSLHYQEEKSHRLRETQAETVTFPDGVFYLFCGKGAQEKVKQLQLELLECLGFGADSAAPPNDSAPTEVQAGAYLQVPSHHIKLRTRLAEQKLLIVLDDVWEREVLQQLLVPAKAVKYLITSQMREIWDSAARIQMSYPTMEEARQIMSNYTKGLPVMGKFPEKIERIISDIIKKLDRHPLSLANIGSSINRSRATDRRHWEAISDNIQSVLDDNTDQLQRSPIYDQPYNLTVKASMMLMVESLHPEAQRLLFLIALLEGHHLPEALVRYFYKVVKSHQNSDFLFTYNTQEQYLEERSLVELHMQPGRHSTLAAHGLRMDYIREHRAVDLGSIASHIIASGDAGEAQLIRAGDAEQTLVTILSAIYFTKPFNYSVVNTLEKHWTILKDGVISGNIDSSMNPRDLVKSTHGIKDLVSLLNVDDGDHDWKQQAHVYAKKIIIKLACQGELDDCNMARLLRLRQTTLTGCRTLQTIIRSSPGIIESHFDENKKTFSSTHGETMESLLIIFEDDAASTETRLAAAGALVDVIGFESRDTIVNVAHKFMELLATDFNPTLQITLMDHLAKGCKRGNARGVLIAAEFTAIVEVVIGLLVFGKHGEVQVCAGRTLEWFCQWKPLALKIGDVRDAFDNLFELFLSEDTFFGSRARSAGHILVSLSGVEEDRVKFCGVKSDLDRLANVLARLVGTSRYISEKERRELEQRAYIAAVLLGELGLDKELRAYISSLPGVEDGLLLLQTIEMGRGMTNYFHDAEHKLLSVNYSTMALAKLYANYSNPTSKKVFCCDKCVPAQQLHWSRVKVYIEMGAYREALENLEVTQHHLDQIANLDDTMFMMLSSHYVVCKSPIHVLSSTRIYLQAMLEDHASALLGANKNVEKYNGSSALIERGIVKRIAGDLQGALDDFNAAYQEWKRNPYPCSYPNSYPHWYPYSQWYWYPYQYPYLYTIFKHRGYVKHLLEDDLGAKEDAEAQKLKLDWRFVEEVVDRRRCGVWGNLPTNYLGYFL